MGTTEWDDEPEQARARFAALKIDIVAMMGWCEESPLPLVAQSDPGSTTLRWSREDGFIEQIHGSELALAALQDGRVVRVVAARHHGERVELIRWDGDAAVRSDGAERSGDAITAFARTYDGGRVRQSRGGTYATLEAALTAAVELDPATTIWDSRLHAVEPWPEDPETLVEPLARGLDAALRAAAGAVEAAVLPRAAQRA